MSAKKKQIPRFGTDEEAERFVDTADLAEYDLKGGVPMDKWLLRYEQYSKDANINLRLREAMLKALARRRAQEDDSHATLYPHHPRTGIDG
jgi:predicted DNA binding CopG/RHH family protein